jgi:hypothetical protein
MTTRNAAILAERIVARSVANNWEDARLEWDLEQVLIVDTLTDCLCSHAPIKEVCILSNRLNGYRTRVGNVCVEKFIGLPSEALFASLRKVRMDPTSALAPVFVEYAYEKKWVNDWEHQFLLDTAKRRYTSMTIAQQVKREEINNLVLKKVEWKRKGAGNG